MNAQNEAVSSAHRFILSPWRTNGQQSKKRPRDADGPEEAPEQTLQLPHKRQRQETPVKDEDEHMQEALEEESPSSANRTCVTIVLSSSSEAGDEEEEEVPKAENQLKHEESDPTEPAFQQENSAENLDEDIYEEHDMEEELGSEDLVPEVPEPELNPESEHFEERIAADPSQAISISSGSSSPSPSDSEIEAQLGSQINRETAGSELSVNLDIPLPSDGFLPSDTPERSPSPMPTPPAGKRVFLDTQTILNAETQLPDLDVPEPEGGFEESERDEDEAEEPEETEETDEALLSQPNPPRSAPSTYANGVTAAHEEEEDHSEPESDAPIDDVTGAQLIADLLAAGHQERHITQALHATTNYARLARTVLEDYLARSRRIPDNVAGVWTEWDDADLEGGDGRGVRRVEQKHGWEACQERLKFLEWWREAQEE